MERELTTLPIDKLTLIKLEKAGFSVIGDVVDFKAFELSKELGVSIEESLSLLKYLQEDVLKKPNKLSSSKNVVSGDNLLKKEKKFIITFSSNLDDLLDGGISLGKITEICGPPGIGKTQFCMQLAIDVQLPVFCGGLESEALYIDTEGSFMVDRVLDIARSTVLHCHSISQNIDNFSHTDKESLENFHVKNILSRIHYFRCYEYIQLIALLHTLEQFLADHSQVRLVVVDSIAYVFRQDIEDFSMRSRHLSFVSQTFSKLCINHNIAVVLVNHMTMKAKGTNRNYCMVPALGEAWGHNCTYRVILHWTDALEDSKERSDSLQGNVSKRQRKALLYKSPSKQDSSAFYQITAAGIRDCLDVTAV